MAARNETPKRPLQDVEDLIKHVQFCSNLGAEDANLTIVHILPDQCTVTAHEIDTICEADVQEAIKTYLRGRGHPDILDIRAILSPAIFERDREDALLRSRLLLHSMTGEEVISVDPDYKLQILFMSLRGQRS
ncbi:hypothetical protein C8T65DRAFT_748778 [Cerioporus squamosus]|nr:hypothetical protein C8T65DRAFT_748778 [Cerioporus squamosus]